ncbi:MAG: hypothetical protein QOK36_2210, partial [Gaiellales bacterium]|nr:hypothetical protein [Gaiellales bacterium]
MSISVEDWDDLSEARRRRDERAALVYAPPGADAGEDAVDGEYPETAEETRAPALTLVADTGVYLDDEAFGEIHQDLRLPASIAA